MSKKITIEEVKKISTLARLQISETEAQKFTEQLSSIFSYIDQLQEVDTKNIQPIAQITGLKNITRADIVNQQEVQDELISNAPEKDGRFIKVKNVL